MVMIEFQLDTASGVATYLQLVQQVHDALQLGLLEPGDQLPTAQQVVAKLAINPNTVLKAYRDLEREGLVRARPGQGTFITRSLPGTDPATQARFLAAMTEYLRSARWAGLGPGDIEAIYRTAARNCFAEGVACPPSSRPICTAAPWQLPPRPTPGSSAPTARARPPCCIWPSGCWHPRRARSRSSVDVRPKVRLTWDGSASLPRTPRRMRGSPWPSPSAWAPFSTRAGTASWPGAGSISSAWTPASGPGRSPVASGPSSPSPWRSRSGPSSCSSMSR